MAPGGVGLTAVVYADKEPWSAWGPHLASFGCQVGVREPLLKLGNTGILKRDSVWGKSRVCYIAYVVGWITDKGLQPQMWGLGLEVGLRADLLCYCSQTC